MYMQPLEEQIILRNQHGVVKMSLQVVIDIVRSALKGSKYYRTL